MLRTPTENERRDANSLRPVLAAAGAKHKGWRALPRCACSAHQHRGRFLPAMLPASAHESAVHGASVGGAVP
jgi:hypothetical protein